MYLFLLAFCRKQVETRTHLQNFAWKSLQLNIKLTSGKFCFLHECMTQFSYYVPKVPFPPFSMLTCFYHFLLSSNQQCFQLPWCYQQTFHDDLGILQDDTDFFTMLFTSFRVFLRRVIIIHTFNNTVFKAIQAFYVTNLQPEFFQPLPNLKTLLPLQVFIMAVTLF